MTEEKAKETSELEQNEQVSAVNPFGDESWAEQPVKAEEATVKVDEQKATSEKIENEIPVPTEWLKKEFDVEDVSIIKAEREELKKLKEKSPAEINFADEQSKQIHELIREGKKKEVRQFLETQEKLETLATAEVTDQTAQDIIKIGLKLKHKDLTDKEVEYKYNKQYGIPKEPVKGEFDDEDEFNAKHEAWKEQVEDVKMSMIIDAKTMRPELEKAKSELVLPEISKKEAQQSKEPTPEDLAAFEKDKTSFLQTSETFLNGFNGFTQQVKDKDVDYTVSYTPSQEEKTFITGKLSVFAESGFDANTLLAERWVSEDGKTMKIDQMVKDLSWLYGQDKVSQKLATDSANKRIEAYLKDKKQINVSEVNQNGSLQMNKDNKNEQVQLQEFFWNQD